MEDSHSGLVHHLGKVAYLNGYREFESLILRTIVFSILPIKITQTFLLGRSCIERAYCFFNRKNELLLVVETVTL